MSNYIVTDTELTAVADAIRTKGGTAALIPWQAGTGFADAVGAIPSGGGASLPSVISKIDGGSFTPSSDLQSSALSISHTLGVVPKGFVIWTEDEISGTVATRYMSNCYVAAANIVDKNSNNYIATGAAAITYNGNASVLASNMLFTTATVQNFMDATRIGWNNTLVYCKAGLTYKWLAWA